MNNQPEDILNWLVLMFSKVSQFRKQIFLLSLEPKNNERNFFSIYAQASKMGQIKKKKEAHYHAN